MNQELIKQVEEWVTAIYANANHLIRTGYWVKQLDPHASDELYIACITHDIERAFKDGNNTFAMNDNMENDSYLRWHGTRSAQFVGDFLKKRNVAETSINKIKQLISVHEFGGNEEENLIKDADSISFFEINSQRFLDSIPGRFSKEQVKQKFDFMYNRISSPVAQKLAAPFYENAIERLDTK